MYKDLEAELHDVFWSQEDVLTELPLLTEFYAHKRSLEIGCGSGRLLLPLLDQGHPIDGIDISETMTQLLAENASKAGLDPKVFTVDILQFEPQQPYERIAIPSFTCQLLTRKGFQEMLQKAHHYTSDEAEIYFTCFIPWAEITGELPEGDWYDDYEATLDNGGIAKCQTKFSINRLEQSLTRRHRYSVTQQKQKREHRCTQTIQWYTLPELTLLLRHSGWNLKQLITDLEPELSSECDTNAHLLTIIASKNHPSF